MDIWGVEKLFESFRRKPGRTSFVVTITVIIFLLGVISVAWLTGFFGEKAKQQAVGPPKETAQTVQSSKERPKLQKKSEPTSAVSQHTEGDKAPIVNVAPGGKSVINYGTHKGKDTSD